MQRLRLEFAPDDGQTATRQVFDVPDVATALVVAEINQANGVAELHDGKRCVARLERLGNGGGSYWHVE